MGLPGHGIWLRASKIFAGLPSPARLMKHISSRETSVLRATCAAKAQVPGFASLDLHADPVRDIRNTSASVATITIAAQVSGHRL